VAPVLFVAALGLLALPGAARRFGRRLHPAEWSWFSVGALVIGAVMLELSVALYATPTTLRAIGVHHLADMCERAVGAVLPGGAVLGWPAAAMAVAFPVRFWLVARRTRRSQASAHIEPCLGQHRHVGGYDLVVVPTNHLLAFSVGGQTSQVVISAGLLETLRPEEVDAVVRHEAAHLDHGHQRLLLLASSLERTLPLGRFVGHSTAALRTGLERWADELAAGQGASSRAILRRALVGVCEALVVPRGVAAFSAADTIAERLEALSAEPPRPSGGSRAAAYVPAMAITAVVVGAAAVWHHDILHVLALIRHHCPT
jgi:Zn-dependent protease with chaperone function